MNKKIGYIGFGKMGLNMALRLQEQGFEIVGYNRGEDKRQEARNAGIKVCDSIAELCESLEAPRVVWVMVSHQGVDEVLKELYQYLQKGDIVVEGGNSFYKDSLRRAEEAEKMGFEFMDIGVSGGPNGARNGACLMIGGKKQIFEKLKPLLEAVAAPAALKYLGVAGAGHFAKMVHNGIEYGMMQSIGEGFEVLKKSNFNYDLLEVAKIYNNKSVIESRLTKWLEEAFEKFGNNLESVSGEVAHTGEGAWTVNTAKELNVPAKVIEDSLEFRKQSKDNPSFTGKVLSALRNRFGGHDATKGQKK